jgi:hypothetical protein
VLALAGIALAAGPASAGFAYTSAEFDVFDSAHTLIDSVSVAVGSAVSGTLYEIPDTTLPNSAQFGNATSLSTGASAAGPYFVTFGVIDTGSGFVLGFSWDPTGNDPYGGFANIYANYDNPPLQAQYTYDATMYLSTTALANGDTAQFVLNAPQAVTVTPEPASLALLASGGFVLVSFTRARRRQRAAA